MSWGIIAEDPLPLLGCIGAYVGHQAGRWCSKQDHLAYFNPGYFGASRLFDLTGLMRSYGHSHPGGEGIHQRRTRKFLWVPYSALDMVGVVDPAILEERHMRVWRSVTALIYYGVIEWHQVDQVLP
ncbi:hypothetical protein PIB30_070744 [Stylosanthes scabra]|uniref:Uncharacterized protein n=1 Tax=Stylosanthes scabra TaxID=79078 RepID=A0ABU6RNR3_9FABA|nr:hypothetical protein [Stylosanthes scabra]